MDELTALIILTGVPHLGTMRIRKLIQHFGSALETLQANATTIASLPDIGEKVASHWESWKRDPSWKHNIALAQESGVDIIPYTHQKYPKRLLEIPDHPLILYIKGTILPKDQRSIAVVGTRQASVYGRECAEIISRDLTTLGFTVVSGLARGIDASAHHGAVQAGGRTLAVIGSGLANIYPPENIPLGKKISEQGAMISEFSMNTPPDRQTFPQRNRIVSGMTMATLLIEAPKQSGAMITADRALNQGRPVFALPGRVDWDSFRGNHHLLKTGQAKIIENAHDIAKHFEDLFPSSIKETNTSQCFPSTSPEEQDFLALLPNYEVSIDEIVQITKLPVMRVSVLLMSLVLKKALREFPGKLYKKVF